MIEFLQLLFLILLAFNWRSKFARIFLRRVVINEYIWWSAIPFLIAYSCHNLLWWISFNFLLKVFMKITVYLVLPSIVAFRFDRFYREGSPLHGYMGSPVTIKKPKFDNSTGFPSKFEHYPFVNSKSQDYVIPQHLSDESNWRRWFSDGAFISRESGKGLIASLCLDINKSMVRVLVSVAITSRKLMIHVNRNKGGSMSISWGKLGNKSKEIHENQHY